MRIAIDYGILSLPGALITRGIPRFTQRQLREVLRYDEGNEYLLLCPSDCNLDLILPEIRAAANVEIHHPPGRDPIERSAERVALLSLAEAFQEWILRREVDVFHCTSPYVYSAPPLWQFDACPMVATLYDVIPLVYPDTYFANEESKERWLLAFTLLHDATRLLAISQTTRREAELYLGLAPERADVVYAVVEPCFRPMAPDDVQACLAGLRRRIPLPEAYALTVTFPAPSKNLPGLLRAYAMLPDPLRERLPLVITCALSEGEMANLMRLAHLLGIEGDLLATGFVSDDELAALYNAATMVVHPSFYEGFGLPVVEAMACGTPVVTTTAASLVEICGGAAILVDPSDERELALAMESMAEDATLRETLKERGLENAARFNTGQLGSRTLACYRRAIDTEDARDERPRIAVRMDTALPQTLDALEMLRTSFEIEVFVADGRHPGPAALHRSRLYTGAAFHRRDRQDPFDLVVDRLRRGGSPGAPADDGTILQMAAGYRSLIDAQLSTTGRAGR